MSKDTRTCPVPRPRPVFGNNGGRYRDADVQCAVNDPGLPGDAQRRWGDTAGPSAPRGGRTAVVAPVAFRASAAQEDYNALAASMGDMVAAVLEGNERITFVERQGLDEVLAELELELAGLTEPRTQARVGRLLGTRYVLSGAVTVLDGTLRANAHLLDVETTRIAASASASGTVQDPLQAVCDVATQLAEGLDFELPKLDEEAIDREPRANLHFMRSLGYYHCGM